MMTPAQKTLVGSKQPRNSSKGSLVYFEQDRYQTHTGEERVDAIIICVHGTPTPGKFKPNWIAPGSIVCKSSGKKTFLVAGIIVDPDQVSAIVVVIDQDKTVTKPPHSKLWLAQDQTTWGQELEDSAKALYAGVLEKQKTGRNRTSRRQTETATRKAKSKSSRVSSDEDDDSSSSGDSSSRSSEAVVITRPKKKTRAARVAVSTDNKQLKELTAANARLVQQLREKNEEKKKAEELLDMMLKEKANERPQPNDDDDDDEPRWVERKKAKMQTDRKRWQRSEDEADESSTSPIPEKRKKKKKEKKKKNRSRAPTQSARLPSSGSVLTPNTRAGMAIEFFRLAKLENKEAKRKAIKKLRFG